MASRSPPSVAENFKLINGVGPAIERRLHKAGILTFAQLATTSPAEIANVVEGLAGLSAERITQQDWIGQARKLAPNPTPTGNDQAAASPGNRQHYATFTVELLLDEENNVRRTQVNHIQSRDQEPKSWAGWNPNRMIDFIVQHANLQPQQVKLAPSVPTPVEPATPAPTALNGMLNLRELKTILAETETPHRLLSYNQSFNVRLILDPSEIRAPSEEPFDYKAAVYARSLKGGPRQTVVEAYGTVMLHDLATITLEGRSLPRGLYRLEAAVTLRLPSAESEIMAHVEGNLLQIY